MLVSHTGTENYFNIQRSGNSIARGETSGYRKKAGGRNVRGATDHWEENVRGNMPGRNVLQPTIMPPSTCEKKLARSLSPIVGKH